MTTTRCPNCMAKTSNRYTIVTEEPSGLTRISTICEDCALAYFGVEYLEDVEKEDGADD